MFLLRHLWRFEPRRPASRCSEEPDHTSVPTTARLPIRNYDLRSGASSLLGTLLG